MTTLTSDPEPIQLTRATLLSKRTVRDKNMTLTHSSQDNDNSRAILFNQERPDSLTKTPISLAQKQDQRLFKSQRQLKPHLNKETTKLSSQTSLLLTINQMNSTALARSQETKKTGRVMCLLDLKTIRSKEPD